MPQSEKDLQAGNEFFGLLQMGPPKAGKTVASVKDSPGPVYVLNADPKGLTSMRGFNTKFTFDDVFSTAAFDKALAYLKTELSRPTNPKLPKPKTIVLDTVSLYAQTVVTELRRRGLESWDLYRELKDVLLRQLTTLIQFPAHLIINSHAVLDFKGEGGSMGTEPMIEGKVKTLLPALLNDWVWLELTPGDPTKGIAAKREWLVGPQGNWKHGCRSLKMEGRITAGLNEFIKHAR
jgi:hypothetical protein